MRTSVKAVLNSSVIFSFLFFFRCLGVRAQDTLIMNDGSEMYVKVIEIGDNKISYKKIENTSGPTYVADLAMIFMAVYKDGKRETFTTNTAMQLNTAGTKESKVRVSEKPGAVLSNSDFEVRVTEVQNIPDKKKKWINVSAMIDIYSNGKFFSKLSLLASQRTDINLNYNKPNSTYLARSMISFYLQSQTLNNLLYEKFENYRGKGYGWALPPDFFSLNPSSCSVAFLQQKAGNKEILGFGGISATKYNLADCSAVEKKLLSVALLWLETNFTKQ